MSYDRELDAIRLRARDDVADAGVDPKDHLIYVTDSVGREGGGFVSFSEAVSWLLGADEHLVGMAACACRTCCPYVGPR